MSLGRDPALSARDAPAPGPGRPALALAGTLLMALAGAVLAQAPAPTPLDAPLSAGEVTTISVRSDYRRPQGVSDWPEDSLFHYRLLLPADYHARPERRYPVLFVAAPQGNAALGAMGPRLRRDRWVVVMLVESRNRSVLWLPNFTAAHDDVLARVRTVAAMRVCTGFSGAARVCGRFREVRPGLRGMVLQGAASRGARGGSPGVGGPPAVAAVFGADDPNRREASRVRRAGGGRWGGWVEIWDGGHAWAPGDVFERALDFVEQAILLEAPYEAALEEAYRWYLDNRASAYRDATGPLARYEAAVLAGALPAAWRAGQPGALLEPLRTPPGAADATTPLGSQVVAREAFIRVRSMETGATREALSGLADAYRDVARGHPGTVYGARAARRAGSLARELGR